MFLVLGFFAELFTLFLLSKTLTNLLFSFFYRLTKSKKISVYLMSLLFLPGTIIHELSHYVMSLILQVRVGQMELMPKMVEDGIKMGSVEIAKTDPIRRMLIGMAPFLFGIVIILGVFFYAVQNELFSYNLWIIAIGYLVFEIGNTMFSSNKDLEGALELVFTLIFISAVLYFVGVRFPSINPNSIFTNELIQQIFYKADLFLLVPIGIDLILIMLLKLLKY